MSKICSDTFEPQTFAQFEILTNWLGRETSSLHQEFLTKCQFLNERHSTLIHNEYQICKIDDAVKSLHANISSVEEEIQQLECELQKWEVAINKIELLQGVQKCDCRITFKSEREKFMEMIQETDPKIKQLQICMSDIEVLKRCCFRQPRPYDIIFRILDWHQETLRSTDKQLDLILDKLLNVSSNCLQ